VLLACDAGQEAAYMEERFGPISFIVKVADTASAIALSERIISTHGALTAGVYSTRPEVIDAMTAATWRSKVALSINLTGGVFVNQSAAYLRLPRHRRQPGGQRLVRRFRLRRQPLPRRSAPLSRLRADHEL
jgi:acyl-CoA reductase-like NAD-dependent aldehyde dehydrogenase